MLTGRLSGVGPPRVLPSGDVLVPFRVVVRRPAVAQAPPVRAVVDVIDCHAVRLRPRRALEGLDDGCPVRVEGALRRRFFRAAGAVASRYDVEASSVRRLRPGTT